MKIITVIGARPQIIKAAMVSREISKQSKVNELIIHTGQHFDENMSSIFFEEMSIPKPDYNLDIQSLSHGAMTGRQLEAIEKVLFQEKPDWVLVYGDTNSTLAGALAAVKLHIPIAHIEAGLRSFNRRMPEEINRVLTDHISDLLFAPTCAGIENLNKEEIDENKLKFVGDVMFDASIHFGHLAVRKSKILEKLNLKPKEYILGTIHREENTDDPEKLKNIFSAFSNAPLTVVIPLHPRTMNVIKELNISLNDQIRLIKPVGYLDMIMLEKNAYIIATDSGGVQKEAFFYKVPCLTMREQTEWIELVKINVNVLVGTDINKITSELNKHHAMDFNHSFYGTGDTAKKIIKILINE